MLSFDVLNKPNWGECMNATNETSSGKTVSRKRGNAQTMGSDGVIKASSVSVHGHTMKVASNGITIKFFEMAAKQSSRTERERIEQISSGFQIVWLSALKSAFNLNQESLATIVNVSTTTLGRLKRDAVLSQVASERIDRVAQVAMLAADVFEDESVAAQWMSKPHDLLGGVTPLSLCETELGARQVRRVLHAIEWGSAA